ncbi:MAG TPA: hypothetical protein VFS43_35690 [Polyangiaceae bacterium]|nr:hypothetical protein [Polyangiaceae bacterium]
MAYEGVLSCCGTGAHLGTAHQTGRTSLVANRLDEGRHGAR